MKEIGNSTRAIDVFVQDQTSPLFQYFLINEQKTDILLTSDAEKDDEVLNVSAGHGFTAADGEMIVLFENNKYIQMKVLSVSTNAITIDHPLASGFSFENTIVYRGNNLLNIDADPDDVFYRMTIKDFTIPIDVSKIILTLTHSIAGDDGKFGGIAELSKGLWFRKENGVDFNLGNYINNQSFKNFGGSVSYTAKGPAGINSTDIIFDIKEIFGQVIRIDPRINDVIYCHIRDDLSGLLSFTVSLVGSLTSGE